MKFIPWLWLMVPLKALQPGYWLGLYAYGFWEDYRNGYEDARRIRKAVDERAR